MAEGFNKLEITRGVFYKLLAIQEDGEGAVMHVFAALASPTRKVFARCDEDGNDGDVSLTIMMTAEKDDAA